MASVVPVEGLMTNMSTGDWAGSALGSRSDAEGAENQEMEPAGGLGSHSPGGWRAASLHPKQATPSAPTQSSPVPSAVFPACSVPASTPSLLLSARLGSDWPQGLCSLCLLHSFPQCQSLHLLRCLLKCHLFIKAISDCLFKSAEPVIPELRG